jgi:hypothetical protein
MIRNKKKDIFVILILIVATIVVAIIYLFNKDKVLTAKYYNPKTHTTFTTEFVVRNGDTINHGKFFRFNAKGVKIAEGVFVNGEIKGKFIHYFDNGKIKNSFFHLNNTITLEDIYYNPNGTVKEYDMYDMSGKLAFIIYFDEKGVTRYDGYPLMEIYQYKFSHKEQNNIKKDQNLKVGDTLKYEYLLANIPNAKRSFKIENLAIDNNKVKRTIIRKPPTILEVKEVLTRKGITTIRAIVQYKFKDKVTPVFNDTISFEVTVN